MPPRMKKKKNAGDKSPKRPRGNKKRKQKHRETSPSQFDGKKIQDKRIFARRLRVAKVAGNKTQRDQGWPTKVKSIKGGKTGSASMKSKNRSKGGRQSAAAKGRKKSLAKNSTRGQPKQLRKNRPDPGGG